MEPRKRRYLKNTVVTLALLAAVAWVVPFFLNAERYRPAIKAGLERSLHRKVTLGHVTLHFFPHLGFTVDDVVLGENPAFGLEPFIRVNRIDCNLLWRSLWHSHLYFGTLRLNDPSINIVRNSSGKWNIENLLLQSGVSQSSTGHGSASRPSNLSIEIQDARLNFKVGENKKPFAIINTNAHLDLDYSSGRLNFRMAGDPVRTDLGFPTPGLVALDGVWSPAGPLGHTLNATLRMQGAMLYDWIPLLTGRNPEVYGVMNSTIHLGGTLRRIKFSGDSRLTQLHRWEQLPSPNDMPCDVHFKGQFDRDDMILLVSGMNVDFAGSQVHLEGSITKVASRPDFDLVVALKRSQLQDLMGLSGRVFGEQTRWGLKGRLSGAIAIRGPWGDPLYGGFLNARDVLLETSSGTFPVSNFGIRIVQSMARLSPVRVRLAPGVEVVAEGTLRHISPSQKSRHAAHPEYRLTLYSHAVNLERLVHFGRALGFLGANRLEAEGIGSFTLQLAGEAWPWGKPSVTAQASIRSARLVIPGLTEPLNIPRARIQVYGRQIMINPLLAVMGTSVFSGWVMHQRGSRAPWQFSLKADKLSIEQVAQWFEGVGNQRPASLFDRLSGLGSLISGRRPSSYLADRLDARGHFATPLLSYRALALHNFQADLGMQGRKVRLAKVSFEAGGGHGEGNAVVDLTKTPAQISGHTEVSGAMVQLLRPYLPPALTTVHGYYSAEGDFEALGLTHAEIVRTLRGRATVQLESVSLGHFDPVRMLARHFGMDLLEASAEPDFVTTATARLNIQDRSISLENFPVELSGTEFELKGTYAFDGVAALSVRADMRGARRPMIPVRSRMTGPVSRLADLRFAGTLRNLEMVPSTQISQTQP
jgi:AsmA family/AsmA-like C-terminal region